MLLRPVLRSLTEPLLSHVGRLRAGGGAAPAPAFNPATEMAGRTDWYWYDDADLTTLFQDIAGTIPVAADGDPIGKQLDKSGNGLHRTAMNGTTARPIWRTDGTKCWIEWNGTSHGMQTAVTSKFVGKTQIVVIAGLRKATSPTGFRAYLEYTTSIGAQAFGLSLPIDAGGGYAWTSGGTVRATAVAGAPTYLDNVDIAFSGVGDIQSQVSMLRINGAQAAFNAGNQGTGGYGAADRLYFGGRTGTTFFFEGREYGHIGIINTISLSLLEQFEAWMAARAGAAYSTPAMSLANVYTPTTFDESAPVGTGSQLFKRTSELAQFSCTTTAEQIQLRVFSTLEPTYIAAADIGILVNGVYYDHIALTGQGYAIVSKALPPGLKTLTLVNPSQTRPYGAGLPEGAFIIDVAADAPMTPITTVPNNRIVVIADSIGGGDAANPLQQYAWTLQARRELAPRSLLVEAYGFRSVHDIAVDSAAITAFVAVLVSEFAGCTGTQRVYLDLGTNDYKVNNGKWSAASFGVAYGNLLDAIHAALPAVHIDCQTPHTRANETVANSFGSVLADFRAEIEAAANARPSYCTPRNGPSMVTYATGMAADNLHLNNTGSTEKKANWLAFGI